MNKTHFEIVEIGRTQVTVDVSLVEQKELWFNATDIAKIYRKKPKDFLRLESTKEYVAEVVREYSGREDPPFQNPNGMVRIKKGGKHQGTWLHRELAFEFAGWCSAIFRRQLHKWVEQRFKIEHTKQQFRLAARTGYLPMSQAVKEAHDIVKFFHFSNEANLLNRIVLGASSKQFKESHGIDDVRDGLSAVQIKWIDKLQRINTGLIELGIEYPVRKSMLTDLYYNTMRLAA